MGGFFGVASKQDCVLELFYGVDYHSHLGTRRAGMTTHGEDGFNRAIHNIENSPFRTKFDKDVGEMKGNIGIGCISDYEPQPLIISSKLGSFAITTVGKVNNSEELLKSLYEGAHSHFQEMSNGQINMTEMIAAMICEKDSILEGIKYVQEKVDGSMTLLVMTEEGIYAARDRYGRTPLVIGQKEEGYCVSGVPDSGIAHAIGYSNTSGIPYARPFIKYTPTWPRSFMPSTQSQRNLIARMKLIPVQALIEDKKLLLIDDSIVRGTQLRETTEFLYRSGAKEVHVRPACPPLLYGCKYLNFSRSKSEMDLITRRVIRELEGGECSKEVLDEYADPTTERYDRMVEEIRKQQNFTTLRYHRLDDLIDSIGIDPCKVCTYCFNGKE